jgi:predicted  nucleic acid-binding Zn-ribbon protein
MEQTERIRIFYEIINKITKTSMDQNKLPNDEHMQQLVFNNDYNTIFFNMNQRMTEIKEKVEAARVELQPMIDQIKATLFGNEQLVAKIDTINSETKTYEKELKEIENKKINNYTLIDVDQLLINEHKINKEISARQLMKLKNLSDRVAVYKKKYEDLNELINRQL